MVLLTYLGLGDIDEFGMKSQRSQRGSVARGRSGTSRSYAGGLMSDEGYDCDGHDLHGTVEKFAATTNKMFDVDGALETLIVKKGGTESANTAGK